MASAQGTTWPVNTLACGRYARQQVVSGLISTWSLHKQRLAYEQISQVLLHAASICSLAWTNGHILLVQWAFGDWFISPVLQGTVVIC